MFRSNLPVTADQFADREDEIRRLQKVVDSLAAGSPRWAAVLGLRKVGKTSLVLELARRNAGGPVAFVTMDLNEHTPLTLDVFRRCALRSADALLGPVLGLSLESLADGAGDLRAELAGSDVAAALPAEVRVGLYELAEPARSVSQVNALLELPERLAAALDRRLLLACDEFQLFAEMRHGSRAFDPLPRMRAIWQRHNRVAYLVSGSAPSMLRELTTSARSPFFQHFELLELGPMPRRDALALLRDGADGVIPAHICDRVFDLVGGHPFYLQLFGQELLDGGPPWDESAFKEAMQRLLFSRVGRLSLFFRREHDRLVGRAATLAAALGALARAGPEGLPLSELATRIGAATGPTARYVERLADTVAKGEDGRWRIVDRVFGLWLRWREPAGRVVPMAVAGSEAELAVARALSASGFDLVYQSRASRGAFDLLALRGPVQLGVQVKARALPLTFTLEEWRRMEAEAQRLRWRWVVAAVDRDGRVLLLDPERARVGRTARLHAGARVDNVLLWLDA